MKMNIYPSATETACALIQRINEMLANNPDKIFNIAFSGGFTPSLMYDLWAHEFVDSTPWQRIHFWWVDERCVRPESSESNYGQMRTLLLNVAPIPQENIFRIQGESDPVNEAIRYSTLVNEFIPQKNNMPLFDIVLLGMGEDGHTSSIFSGQEHLLSSPEIYEATYNPYSGQKRIALTGRPIINAELVVFLVTGKNKTEIVKEVVSSGDRCPASYILHHSKNVEMFLDRFAAAGIKGTE